MKLDDVKLKIPTFGQDPWLTTDGKNFATLNVNGVDPFVLEVVFSRIINALKTLEAAEKRNG